MALVLVVLRACAPTPPSVPGAGLNERFSLEPGRGLVVDHDLTVIFTRLLEDTRCPSDVVCIQAGDAVAEIRAGRVRGPVEVFRLAVLDRDRSTGVVLPYRVELLEVMPVPLSTRPIDPGEYRATLRVSMVR